MPKTRYLTLEEALQRLFEEDSDNDDEIETDIIVIPPETAEASDEEEGNDNILNNGNDILPYDTAGEIEVCLKKKFCRLKAVHVIRKKIRKQKCDDLKCIKKDPLNMTQPKK